MLVEDVRINRRAELVKEPGRALYVGEEERHRARRKIAPHAVRDHATVAALRLVPEATRASGERPTLN
jgi:hypothetical protein